MEQKLKCKKDFIKYGNEIMFFKNNTYYIEAIDNSDHDLLCEYYLILIDSTHGRWFSNNNYSKYDYI